MVTQKREEVEVVRLNINSLEKLLKKGYGQIEKSIEKLGGQIQEAVLVIGDTGSCKSTLVNAFIGNKLEAVRIPNASQKDARQGKHLELKLSEGQDGPKMGSGKSVTTAPKPWISPDKTVYVDCPGFGDTRGPEHDITNGFLINRIFELAERVKIVWVVTEAQLENNNRYRELIEISKGFVGLFDNFDAVKDSVSVIVTKADSESVADDFRGEFSKVLKTYSGDKDEKILTDKVKDFFEYIASPHSKMSVVHRAMTEGPFEFAEGIFDNLKNCRYSEKVEVKIPISFESKDKLRDVYEHYYADISKVASKLLVSVDKIKQENELGVKWAKLMKLASISRDLLKVKSQDDLPDLRDYAKHMELLCKESGLESSQNIDNANDNSKEGSKNDSDFSAIYFQIRFEMARLCKKIGVGVDINEFAFGGVREFERLVTSHMTSIESEKVKKIADLLRSLGKSFNDLIKDSKKDFIDDLKIKMLKLSALRDQDYLDGFLELFKDVKSTESVNESVVKSDVNELKREFDDFMIICKTSSDNKKLDGIIGNIAHEFNFMRNMLIVKDEDIKKKTSSIEKAFSAIQDEYITLSVNNSGSTNELRITGNYLELQKYAKVISKFNSEKSQDLVYGKFLVLYGANKITLDSDLQFEGNIVLVAPTIICPMRHKFNLAGRDGSSASSSPATHGTWNVEQGGGSAGSSGSSGTSGNPGGMLVMLAQQYKGLDNLEIDVSGGRGGNGQAGGNGGGCNSSYLTYPQYKNGGNGGRGGDAYKGALPGIVRINKVDPNDKEKQIKELSIEESKIKLRKAVGTDGTPGYGGTGGEPWNGKSKLYDPGTKGYSGSKGSTYLAKSYNKSILEFLSNHMIAKDYHGFVMSEPSELSNGVQPTTLGELGYENFFNC